MSRAQSGGAGQDPPLLYSTLGLRAEQGAQLESTVSFELGPGRGQFLSFGTRAGPAQDCVEGPL